MEEYVAYKKTSNARHHPPRIQPDDGQVLDEGRAIRGRVHAVVSPRRNLKDEIRTKPFIIRSNIKRFIRWLCQSIINMLP